ncbi:MAG: ATP-binding protein [Porcipelethomonas sp.]
MKNETKFGKALLFLNHYIIFFMLAAFVITCCMTLFVSTLSKSLGMEFSEADLETAAKLTFGNVVILSFVFTVLDVVRRKFSVNRPIKKIMGAAEKIMHGDFTVRIQPFRGILGSGSFNQIIECFNKMAEELSGAETLRTDFIANVSHELKTPLAVMQNYGTMLRKPGLSEEKRMEYAKSITDSCRRLAGLVTNILKLNKLENQQIFPTAKTYDLSEQLCECLLRFEDTWEKKNIDIAAEIEERILVESDPELLELVWNNLFSNAFKFTDNGGRVLVCLTADECSATIKISDTGCGMSPEVGSHIFEKFYQGDTSHSTQGNGLGLALVKRVVDIMHGEINVESVKGKGCSFTVKIWRQSRERLENDS